MVQCETGNTTGATLIRYLGFRLRKGSRKVSSFRPSRLQEVIMREEEDPPNQRSQAVS